MNICVPSLDRSNSSHTLAKLKIEGLLQHTHIFVYSFDVESYKKAYPEANVVDCGNYKNLARKRNKILEYGLLSNWKHLLMMDDDITSIVMKNEAQNIYAISTNKLYEELLNIRNDFVIAAPRYNFISCDNITSSNKLIEFSSVSSVLFFNLENLKDYRFDESMIIEDMDLFLNIVLNGDKVYKLRYIQASNKIAQKGGYQSYTKVEERHLLGLRQLFSKYEDADKFISLSKNGFVGLNKRRLEKYVREYKTDKVQGV